MSNLGAMVLQELMTHYVVDGTSVCSRFLDASKAVDGVHNFRLFTLLIEHELPAWSVERHEFLSAI
jgi:hypothetical protein